MNLINGLHFNNIRGDISGGISTALISLPLALAFGVASGAGPVAGLYGSIIAGFFAALFGGTPSQISGPTTPMVVVMMAIIMQFTLADPTHGLAIAFTVVMLGGVLQVLFGLFKFGHYLNMLPHPVISGFMSGVGVIIILMQLGPLLGQPGAATTLDALLSLPKAVLHPSNEALFIAAICLGIVYLQPKNICKFFPRPLTALLIGSMAYLLLFPHSMIKTIGHTADVTLNLQSIIFDTSLILEMFKSALVLAIVGSIDSLMSSVVADNITRQQHDSDRELIGQGLANTLSGLFGGLPGAGDTTRTVVNDRHGGRTPLSAMVYAGILLAILLSANSLFHLIPHVVLAAILIHAGTDIIDWDYLRRLHRAPLAGAIVMLLVFLLTVFVDLLLALAVGVTLVSLLFMKRMSDLQLQQTSTIQDPDNEHPLTDEEMQIFNAANGSILLFHVSGPMSFGAAKAMNKRVSAIDNYEVLILDLSDVPMIDFSSSLAIEDIILNAQEAGHHLILCGAQPDVHQLLERQGILKLLLDGHEYDSRVNALKHAAQLLEIRT